MDPISSGPLAAARPSAYVRPNPHSVSRAPGRDLFLTCDKGRSRFYWFRLDHAARSIVPLSEVDEVIDGRGGWGCRYAAWHPSRDVVYINNEKEPLFTAWSYDEDGGMSLLQSLSPFDDSLDALIAATRSHRPGMKFEQQDLRISPDGRFLYNCSRLADESDSVFEVVTVFEVLPDATLRRLQVFHLEGGALWPRGAAISNSGRWLIVACVYSHEILVLAIGADGRLSHAGRYPCPSAANVCFLPW